MIVLFDDNGISIDGPLSLADSVDQVKRFEAAGWAAVRIDGHDPAAIARAIETAKSSGAPPGADKIRGAPPQLGWLAPPFEVPADVRTAWRKAGDRGKPARQ